MEFIVDKETKMPRSVIKMADALKLEDYHKTKKRLTREAIIKAMKNLEVGESVKIEGFDNFMNAWWCDLKDIEEGTTWRYAVKFFQRRIWRIR